MLTAKTQRFRREAFGVEPASGERSAERTQRTSRTKDFTDYHRLPQIIIVVFSVKICVICGFAVSSAERFPLRALRLSVHEHLDPLKMNQNHKTLAKTDGYRGIWYFNQPSDDEYRYKYSGGLGTYCAKHIPLAYYAKEVDKTFFC